VRSVPCTWRRESRVSWLSLKTKVDGFVSGLESKPLGRFLTVWPQNCYDSFLQFDLKTGGDGFSRFSLKTGCWFLG
jgi:hypothetical protein